VDPLFINAAAGNYHIQAISQCMDAGYSSHPDMTASDVDGDLRVINAVEIGADEVPPSGPVTSVNLTPDKAAPADLGDSGNGYITAAASGGSGSYVYEFWLMDPDTNVWTMEQGYSSDATWTWTPAKGGYWRVMVKSKNAKSTALQEASRTLTYRVIGSPPVQTVSLVSNKVSPVGLGPR